jgi:hypothetical protein
MNARVFLIVLLLLLTPVFSVGAQEINAGFVQGLWYSQESFFAGDPVRIYVALRNNTGSDLSGTVEFFDGEDRIGRKNVEALDGRIIESWVDWTPTYGSHTISATLSRIELHTVGSSTQQLSVTSELAQDTLFIDHDTDGDTIGNEDDSDDDGDGISDKEEVARGSDPLEPDTQQEDTDEEVEDAENEEDTAEESSADTNRGLERYLTDSPAEEVLSSITTYVTEAKDDLDRYRAARDEKKAQKKDDTSNENAPEVDANGFGEITRSSSSEESGGLTFPAIQGEKFFDKLFNLISSVIDIIYSTILLVISFILGHPAFVQVGILIVILFLLLKFASKFGRRPKKL